MSDSEGTEVKRRKVVISDDEDEEQNEQLEQPIEQEQVEAPETSGDKNGDAEEIDDLFGDDDDEVDGGAAEANAVVPDDEEEEEEDDGFGGADFTVPKSPEPRELRIGNEDIVRHPPRFHTGDTKDIYDAKVPKFFKINPVRFDGNDYLQKLNQQHSEDPTIADSDETSLQRLVDENTIRWRFTKQQSSQTLKAESNAQIVEWEDGTLSLKLGDEVFDVLQSDLKDTYLTTQNATNDENNKVVHLVDGLVSKSIKFVPTSTNSNIHKRLTSALQSRQENKASAQNVYVEVDPEKEARKLEKLVEDQIREKRRQALKLEKEQERTGSVGAHGSSSNSATSGSRFTRESLTVGYEDEDEDEDEDGFIDDYEEDEGEGEGDEDEDDDDNAEDEATERLKRIKQSGTEQYSEDATVRKKRRVISDDEDDE
jgi:RNA polymerase-associated protein LEO1